MGRLLTPKRRAKVALKVVRAITRRHRRDARDDQRRTTPRDEGRSEHIEDIDRILTRATKAAFKKAGLDINDDEDWKFLLPWLAWAIFDKDPGRSLDWTKQELRQLRADVTKLRSNNPKLTELKCCEALVKEVRYVDKGITASTLRRRLQQAKKLDLKPRK